MMLRDRMTVRFTNRVITSLPGRAHLLNQLADAEGNGENGFFEHILRWVDDPQLDKIIRRHRQDELRHQQLFIAARERTGLDPGPVPPELKLIDRLDRAVGGFFDHPIRNGRDLMDAYLLLQVIEERAVTQFALFEHAFCGVDDETAAVIAGIARDEERHLKYCRAIARRYAPDERTERETVRERSPVRPRLGGGEPRREMAVEGRQRALRPRRAAAHRIFPHGGCVMKRTQLLLSALLVTGVATGCTRANTLGLAPLDQPARIRATGATPQSEVTMYRKGVLDPRGSLSTITVRDASLRVSTTVDKAVIEELTLDLADADLSPSEAMPHGLKLRNQQLSIRRAVAAPMVERNIDAVTVRGHAALTFRASMLLDNGTLYPLGPTETEAADFDLRATLYEFGVHVTLDSAPQGKCWSIPGVIDVSDCSLFVETDGDATND